MVTCGVAVGVLVLSEVVIGGFVALLFPTDRVVWIYPASRLTRNRLAYPSHFAGAATLEGLLTMRRKVF